MRLKEDELVFYDYQWIVNNNVVSGDLQYVSPFFGLDISPHIREAASFRFGIRLTTVESKVKAMILLYVHYLDILGIGVTDVECFIDVSQSLKLRQTFRDCQTMIFESQEFYPATENGVLVQEAFVLIYRIYPTNSCYGYTMDGQPILDYGFEQCDTNFGEEMWSAAQKRELTDCEFVVNQTIFHGHRPILAARCPALVDWHYADQSSFPIVDTDEAVFEAFLYFLYTGQISLPVDTDMYRHFIDLFMKYVNKRLPDEIADPLSSLNECITESTVHLSQNHGKVSFVRRGISLEHSYECCFKLFEKPSIQTARFNGKGSFNVSLKKLKAYSDECQCELSISNSNPVIGLNLIGVSCYRQGIKCHLTEFKEERFRSIVMLPRNPRNSQNSNTGSPKDDSNFLEISNSDRYSFVTDLEICLAEEEDESWGYRLRDLLLCAHLWSVYTTKEWTDVQLCMSRNNSFPAHRAILSARSPVFASIFKSNRQKKISIEDMDPELFEDFLFFIYTGSVRNTENLPDLWAVGKKYQVKTLEKISEFA